MAERDRNDVISNLPRHRPHRRSDKRGAPPPPPDGSSETSAAGRAATPSAVPKPRSAAGRGTRPAAAKPVQAGKPAARSTAPKPGARSTAAKPAARSAATKAPAESTAKTAKPPRSPARDRIGSTAGAKTRAERTEPTAEAKARGEQIGPRGPRPAHEPSPERPSGPPSGGEVVGTVVQAAGELAQIGLALGAQAVKNAVKKLPKP